MASAQMRRSLQLKSSYEALQRVSGLEKPAPT